MGVPAFFRWLTRKFPSVIVECIEEMPVDVEGNQIPIITSNPNPNGVEFDNLYLDMNGIIHPCTHPENKPPPKNEDEMMQAIFECIDRLFAIVRPRKLLYMAIDGVAPRAKMNQQRSRRFRSSKESHEKIEEVRRIREELINKGIQLPPEKSKEEHFDSNCITPGTPFMDRLSKCLNYYIHDRLTNDPGWKGVKVILSDANVPGEGEHKIMDFIRRQRAQPDHDPNTHHCLCGADADLIMLGLATHEANFTIIREEFVPGNTKKCDICGQEGHEMKDCLGVENTVSDTIQFGPLALGRTKYIFVRLNVLREYLERELYMSDLPFKQDFERAIDDWVFMCFFVGNDFLPHLPSLEIREGAIDRLVGLYKNTIHKTGGYITDSGFVHLDRVQLILKDLGYVEDEIFRNRQSRELMFRQRNKNKLNQERRARMMDKWHRGETFDEPEIEDEPELLDDIRLWEDGYKHRYYEQKFHLTPETMSARFKIAMAYVEGLCWVLRYYYQGCSSWKWYFPYHYAPFASDFINIQEFDQLFEKKTEPFKPLEQLMGVFPAASRAHVPEPWGRLMTDKNSPISDFYPVDFKIDLNGKKFAWQGVALLPFVDENRLFDALKVVYSLLTSEEVERNVRGVDKLYLDQNTETYDFVKDLKNIPTAEEGVDYLDCGVKGTVFFRSDMYFQGSTVYSPVQGLKPVFNNVVYCVAYQDPQYEEDYKFTAIRLPGAKDPPRVLKHEDDNSSYRPLIGMVPSTQRASLGRAGHRFIGAHSRFNPTSSEDRQGNSGRYGGGGRDDNSGGSSGSSHWLCANGKIYTETPYGNQQNYYGQRNFNNWNRGDGQNYNKYNPSNNNRGGQSNYRDGGYSNTNRQDNSNFQRNRDNNFNRDNFYNNNNNRGGRSDFNSGGYSQQQWQNNNKRGNFQQQNNYRR